jgi:hypothetical protein
MRLGEGASALEAVTRQRLVKAGHRKDLVRGLVNCRACDLAIALWLLVVTFCKILINSVAHPKPTCSYTPSCDNVIKDVFYY